VGELPVGGRGEVRASAEQQPVEPVEQRVRVVGVAVRGENDGDAARFLDRLGVGQPQREPGRREVALAAAGRRSPGGTGVGLELVGDDADQRRVMGACTADDSHGPCRTVAVTASLPASAVPGMHTAR
jgi:hypothetical protein